MTIELDPKLLRYLQAVDECGTFVKAAQFLGLSQPALSVAIARLEDIVQMPLVERGRHGAKLNAAGAILARHATSLAHVLTTARAELEQFRRGSSGPVSIGGTPLAMAGLVPEAVSQISSSVDTLNLCLVEGDDGALLDKLERHEIDMAVCTLMPGNQRACIKAVPLFTARMIVAVRPGHEFADRGRISLRHLAGKTWALPPKGDAFRQSIEALLATHQIAVPHNIVEAEHAETLKRVVMASEAVMLLSHQVALAELTAGALVPLELDEAPAPRQFALHLPSQRQQSAFAQAMAEHIQRIAPHYSSPALP
ncbi:LysR family transcriptional regulator [Devosia sp.]|uniref:LysR family transcriptional regulator n=1 Tax=Devosia sp. TaxID=1871048 RepID=UPI002732EE16|nr:LysR family transcriptional regulator [Devosia sp.]MDP2779646.1 LysR family transcriptional regulator [Devosia sp.]